MRDGRGGRGPRSEGRVWVGPAVGLVAISLAIAALVHLATGGREIGDDAPRLLSLSRQPLALLGNYEEAGFGTRWGSFPPLLPLVFGSLLVPWTLLVPDFWAVRLGVLSWSLVVLLVLDRLGSRVTPSPTARRATLWTYALLPSVWGTTAIIPQEEIYVALFPLLLWSVASRKRWRVVAPLVALSALSGKYALLITIIPLAWATPWVLRGLLLFGVSGGGALAAYLAWHRLAHGLSPVTGYVLDPQAGTSVWALLWSLGIRPDPAGLELVSIALCGLAVVALTLRAERGSDHLERLIATSLLVTTLGLSIAVPGYVLWSAPLVLLHLLRPGADRGRLRVTVLLVVYGMAEWGANFARGVARAAESGLPGGKGAIAELARGLFGPDFPFEGLHVACLVLVIASGLGLLAWLARDRRKGVLQSAVAALCVLLPCASAQAADKRADIPGYDFFQLTDNDVTDWYPRVSAGGLLVWTARSQLPGARSASTSDFEVFLWNGEEVEQITDDDVRQDRPVVNDRGDVAWQEFGADAEAEIAARILGERIRITDDVPPVSDRYPDINDRGVIVWGRRTADDTSWRLAVFDPEGPSFHVVEDGLAYRPHVNNLDHVAFTGGFGVYDLDRQIVRWFARPSDWDYVADRRSELNDRDQVVIEGDPSDPPSPDYQGPRQILFWDGTRMNRLHSSPVWAGRPDLNERGLLVWEGFGGLEGSVSSGVDKEIFVHDPSTGVTSQLTDDDREDVWPTVTRYGRIVWFGRGGYPGSTSGGLDHEIFLALPSPDADRDGLVDGLDDCVDIVNELQEDFDGDGVGDACDNCVREFNPSVASIPEGRHTTGGQLDDDLDGAGNACDGDHTLADPTVGASDLLSMFSSVGKRVQESDCPLDDGSPGGACARFDLDGQGLVVGAADLLRQIELRGTRPEQLRCDACPLACAGDACP